MTTRIPRALRPFRHREYRLLAVSMAVSLFASGVWLVGIVRQVIEIGGGSVALLLTGGLYVVALLALLPMRTLVSGGRSVLRDLGEGFATDRPRGRGEGNPAGCVPPNAGGASR